MIDPFSAVIASLAAAWLLRNSIRASDSEAQREARVAADEIEKVERQLQRDVASMTRKQALSTIRAAKFQYVSKAQQFYALKTEYRERLDVMWTDIRRINAMKAQLYDDRAHGDIPVLKAKTNELHAVVKEISAALKDYDNHVRHYNGIVARIKQLEAEYN
ncbi:MAG TPA: hypothetical protein VHP37_28100 [Burkholderiales bacterium]|nr:hypothetical protein [Burkholderiales bacterium]